MKIKRMPHLGQILNILTIILLLTTMIICFSLKNKNNEVKTINNSINIIVKEQKATIEKLEAENNELTIKNQELAEKNKQLESKLSAQQTKKNPQPNVSTKSISSSQDLGNFKVSAYCHCSKCCGKSDGITATGTKAEANRTVAVDPKVIPLGTKIVIDGQTYIAEDTGGHIKGNRIDMYFQSHQEALNWGVRYKNITIII